MFTPMALVRPERGKENNLLLPPFLYSFSDRRAQRARRERRRGGGKEGGGNLSLPNTNFY